MEASEFDEVSSTADAPKRKLESSTERSSNKDILGKKIMKFYNSKKREASGCLR
jgi:hypothetical protein